MRTVLIAAFDGVQSLDVTGPLEVFAHANEADAHAAQSSAADVADLAGAAFGDGPAYQIRVASLGGASMPQARARSPRSAPGRSCSPRRGCSPGGA